MNAYLASVIENVKARSAHEPEFVQTVEEVFSSLEPVIAQHPEMYQEFNRMKKEIAALKQQLNQEPT